MEHLNGASLGYALALPGNIRLGWKGLSGTNTLGLLQKSVNYGRKSFIVQAPEGAKKRKKGEGNK
jgi:hypothetical protein